MAGGRVAAAAVAFPRGRRRLGGAVAVSVVLAACTTTFHPTAEQQRAQPLAPDAVRVYVAGDVADCRVDPPGRAPASLTARLVPRSATVLAPGDLVYPLADAATLAACYGPTWGAHRETTLPAAGNHDYVRGDSADFRAYFHLERLAASEGFLAYTKALSDDWLLVVVDSSVSGTAMRRQREWLEATLARARLRGTSTTEAGAPSTVRCLAVMWHAPVFSSGMHRGSGEHMRPLWQLIDAHDADLLLSGHEHFYEAFDPIDGDFRHRDDGDGVRQFTVGTGGARLHGFWKPPYASRARVLAHGVLELTLEPGRYAWRFLDVDGRVRDAGSAACRGGL